MSLKTLFVLGTAMLLAGCERKSSVKLLPGERYSQSEMLAGVELGKPVVLAIYEFERDHGHWPMDLEELVPEYLPVAPVKNWRYHTFNHDDFAIVYLRDIGGVDSLLRYERGGGANRGWHVNWGYADSEAREIDSLTVDQPKPLPTKLTQAQSDEKACSLLKSRIARMPNRIKHRIGLMQHYDRLKQFDDARKVAVDCIEQWPDYWWSYMMLAKIDAQRGEVTDAEARLKALARRWNDFFGYAMLAQFYFDQRAYDACQEALKASLIPAPMKFKDNYPYEVIGERDSTVSECYYHNAALLAYEMGERKLCLAICDRWREFCRDVQHYGGKEEQALRIACRINDSDWASARELLNEMKRGAAEWQNDGIAALQKEIDSQNAAYRHPARRLPFDVEYFYK